MSRPGGSTGWRYPVPLEDAVLVRRYKRFLADVALPDGREMTVHCANPGAMTSCCEAGRPVRIQDSQNPKRKLQYSLEQIQMGRSWVAVHTGRANAIIKEVLRAGTHLPWPPTAPESEVHDGADSRLDFRLPGPPATWIEVKNVTLRVGTEARFPDSVTKRGQKHLAALAARVAAGEHAAMVYWIARADITSFRPAWDVDPAYARALQDAVAAGVQVHALRGHITRTGLGVKDSVPVHLDPPSSR